MQKTYTFDFTTSPKNKRKKETGLKAEVLNNILNFSRSLEVLKAPVSGTTGTPPVEIVLN